MEDRNTIIPLWSICRSLSTAFERMMMERGDFTCYHEPFSYYYYLGAKKVDPTGLKVNPDQPVEFDDILAMITREAENRPVFFKDMAYSVLDRADHAFLRRFTNTFIIRHPSMTLRSQYKLNPEFGMGEVGYEEQARLFQMAGKATHGTPIVIDAEDLIADPASIVRQYCELAGIEFLPAALSWAPEFKKEWEDWGMWHAEVADSTGFVKNRETFDFEIDDVPRLKDMYDQSLPYYEILYDVRIRP